MLRPSPEAVDSVDRSERSADHRSVGSAASHARRHLETNAAVLKVELEPPRGVFVTGFAPDSEDALTRTGGAVLSKPFLPAALLACVQEEMTR